MILHLGPTFSDGIYVSLFALISFDVMICDNNKVGQLIRPH